MIRRPPRSTRTDTLFPTRRSSDLTACADRPGQPRGCLRDADRFGRGAARMSALWTVCLKELRELSRDRRTLMLALVMGPLLMPALLFGILTLAQSRAKSQIEKPLQVAIVGADRAPELVKWLAAEGIERKTLDGDPDAAIRSQDEDAYLRIGDDFGEQWTSGTPALVEIVHDSTRQDSAIPVRRIENALQRYGQQVGALRLLARGINPAV